jgi:hypothetical protein
MRNLKVVDSKNWSVHLANFEGVSLTDVWLVNGEAAQDNHDGLHVNGPGRNLAINNLRLTAQTDDGIAINADDGNASSIVGPGSISNVHIDGVYLDSCNFGVRVISNGSRVDNISVRNLYGTVKQDGYLLHVDDLSYYFGSGTGNIGRVSLDDVSVTVTAEGTNSGWAEAIRVEANIEELTVTNFKQGAGWYPDYRPIIRVLNNTPTTGYGNIRVLKADFIVHDPAGTDTLPGDARAAPRLKVEGNIENLIYHINHYRDPACTRGMGALHIDSGDASKGIGRMEFSGVVNRQANTLVLTSGRFDNLRINGLTDLDNITVTILLPTPGGIVGAPFISISNWKGGTLLGGPGAAAAAAVSTGDLGAVVLTGAPVAGQLLTAISGTEAVWAGGAWQSWIPVWTNLSVGDGTVVARYAQIGKSVFVRLSIVFGSTTSVSGSISFTLPVARIAYGGGLGLTPLGTALLWDSSAGVAYAGRAGNLSTTEAQIFSHSVSGTAVVAAAPSSTQPFTWAVGDEIDLELFYEAA